MRHGKKRLQLNRFTSWYKATLKSLARSVLLYQSIKTTRAKAFAVKPLVERLITLAKANTLAAKRQAYDILGDHTLVSALFNDIGPRFNNRTGGYVRILNLDTRRGDSAKLVVLELTEIIKKQIKKPKEEEKKTAKGLEKPAEEVKPKTEAAIKEEKHAEIKKPPKNFFGGIRKIFKKERDSL